MIEFPCDYVSIPDFFMLDNLRLCPNIMTFSYLGARYL